MLRNDPTLAPAIATMPGLEILLGPDAEGVIRAANRSDTLELRDVTVTQVSLRPGRRVLVQFRLREVEPSHEAVATYVATIGVRLPATTAIVEGRGHEIGVWRYPHDPVLTGIERVSGAENASSVLEQFGVDATEVTIRHRSYRPTRRAVVELLSADHRLFAKVVAPDRVERLRDIHQTLSSTVRVPMVRGWSQSNGIVVLDAIHGQTLRQALAGGATPVDPSAIKSMLSDLRSTALDGRPRPRASERVHDHAEFLTSIAPSLGTLIEEVRRSVTNAGIGASRLQTIHGDLHASQLLIDDGHLSGLIDVDRAGPGDPVTDPANLLAHIAVLASTEAHADQYDRYLAALWREFSLDLDPRSLQVETGAAVVGLATGPFRVLAPNWLELTEQRLDLARRWSQGGEPRD